MSEFVYIREAKTQLCEVRLSIVGIREARPRECKIRHPILTIMVPRERIHARTSLAVVTIPDLASKLQRGAPMRLHLGVRETITFRLAY